MEIRVKVKLGMDYHFKNTIESFDKDAVRRKSVEGPWDFILSNVTKVSFEEVAKWQCVAKAECDKPKKLGEFKMSDLLKIVGDYNYSKGRKESHSYKMTISEDGKESECSMRLSSNGDAIRVESGKGGGKINAETIFNYGKPERDLPITNSSRKSPKSIILLNDGMVEKIVFDF